MTVIILANKSLKVDAILIHHGHEKKLQYLCITKRKGQKQGVSQEEVRESVSGN